MVRQTSCRFCGLDIEGWSPYPAGAWRDRGGETHCRAGQAHAPYRPGKDDPPPGVSTVTMRLSRNHRKHRRLEEEIPEAKFLISTRSSWLYLIPITEIDRARSIGLTVYHERG
jgi:hypothetical protein